MNIENQLKDALVRKQPPPDFAERVVAAAREGKAPRALGEEASPALLHWRPIAAAITLTALLGGWTAHEIAERREGERARDEVMLALHIAGEKVRHAQTQVHDIGKR